MYTFSLKIKWGYISAYNLETERALLLPVSISLKPRHSGVSLELPGLENIPQVPGNQAKVRQNYHARKAVPATISVLK